MIPPVAVGAIVFGLFCGWIGMRVERAGWLADQVEQVQQASADAKVQATESNRIETVYVDLIQHVEVPVDRVRRELVAGVCPAPSHSGPVPGSDAGIAADGATASDADTELVDRIARDAEACIRNGQQLEQLQALIRANTGE